MYSILQRANEEIKYKEKLRSILHVQASLRAFFIRVRLKKQCKNLKEKVERFHYLKACLILQSGYRGYRVRQRFATLITACRKIQSFMRTRWMRSYFLNLRDQVIKIQRIFRSYRLRRVKHKQMLSHMLNQIENVNAFQVIENALLYGVSQKTTLQFVFEISQGKRIDFVEVLQSQAKNGLGKRLPRKRRRGIRSRSRDKSPKTAKSMKLLYKDMEAEADPEWRRLKREYLRQNDYVKNLSPGKALRNFSKRPVEKDVKLDQYVSIVERGELSSTHLRIRKDLEDQAAKLRNLDDSYEFEGNLLSVAGTALPAVSDRLVGRN